MFLNDLTMIAKITPGMTLSDTTMTLVDHNSWSGSFWRRYSGENRQKTLDHISGILADALGYEKFEEIEILTLQALEGVENLKETYKDDKEFVEKIDRLLVQTRNSIRQKKDGIVAEPVEEPEV